MAKVLLENVYKTFQPSPQKFQKNLAESDCSNPELTVPQAVLRQINLTAEAGEFLVLVGPSGCGKSTLLRLIAGLEPLSAGNIWIGGTLVNNLPPKARDIAMVFQNYALYPHLRVYDNLAFGLRRMGRQLPAGSGFQAQQQKTISDRVLRVAELLQIESLLKRYPKELSGGQKQRVALGRAIARNPQVFLMDEPLSNLDARLRTETRAQIVELQRDLGITTIYVTHDQTEAMTMGSRIAVMDRGQIQQIASPLEIYNTPANRFVAEFMGSPPMNFLSVQYTKTLLLTHPGFQIVLPYSWEHPLQSYDQKSIILGIRPEHFRVNSLELKLDLTSDSTANLNRLKIRVHRLESLGHETLVYGELVYGELVQPQSRNFSLTKSAQILVRVSGEFAVTAGDLLWLEVMVDKLQLFDSETGLSLLPKP